MVLLALYCSVPPPKLKVPKDPKASLLLTINVPELKLVPPLYVLVPEKMNLPPAEGLATKVPVPLMLPLKLTESALNVKVLLAAVVKVCSVYPLADPVPLLTVPLELTDEPDRG